MTRRRLLTQKVKTKFSTMYVHVSHDGKGRVLGLSFSTPGKILDSQLDDVIRQMGEAANSLIREASEQK